MSMQGVLIARALVWFLIGIAMFVSLSYQTPEEKKAGKREKKTMRIIVARNDLTDLLSEGTWYTVTYETRSKVVVKIHELE